MTAHREVPLAIDSRTNCRSFSVLGSAQGEVGQLSLKVAGSGLLGRAMSPPYRPASHGVGRGHACVFQRWLLPKNCRPQRA